MALGAAAADIRRLILREGMTPAAAGLAFGWAGSFAVNRLLQSQLVGVSPDGPLTMTAVPVILMLVTLTGCLLPSRRAACVDPSITLRND